MAGQPARAGCGRCPLGGLEHPHPSRIGLGVAWLLGIVMDVHQGVLLGQHALAYSVLSYGAISLHRRLEGFDRKGQAVHVLGLFVISTSW